MQSFLCVQLFFQCKGVLFPLKRAFEYRVSEAVQGNLIDYCMFTQLQNVVISPVCSAK